MSAGQTYTAAGGARLTEFLDALPVTTRWLSGHHIVWQTGQQNAPEGVGTAASSHCSAFVAATAQTLDIYVLRPPDHGQELLANAQADWLAGAGDSPAQTAEEAGWTVLGSSGDEGALDAAAAAAGMGRLVLAIYKASPTTDSNGQVHQHPGHVCIVRPPDSAGAVGDEGPEVMSVGETNGSRLSMQAAFRDHRGAWPSAIQLYAHRTDLEQDNAVVFR